MTVRTLLRRNLYRDSVSLMRLASDLERLPGVRRASAQMATAANLALLAENGIAVGPIEGGPNDLLIAVEGEDEAGLDRVIEAARAALEGGGTREGDAPAAERRPRSLVEAAGDAPDATLALISCPGAYATAEAMKALRLGLDAMIFSDNVSLEDEIALKREAHARGRLVMGPDCGSAIINGVPLGFANAVQRGSVGIVAAAGTGLQQVSCLLDRYDAGVSQAIGTGGRDLADAVGGITMLDGIAALADDPATEALVLISKPPGPEVARHVIEAAAASGKRIVVDFLGAAIPPEAPAGITFAETLEDAALIAAGKEPVGEEPGAPTFDGGKCLRGFYSGGSFCYEAQRLIGRALGEVRSNVPLSPANRLDPTGSEGDHVVLDLGDDAYTRGRPHPMIDFQIRNEKILEAAADPTTGVILLDVVLGTGAHPDPVSALAPALDEAAEIARDDGREVTVVGFVCGTDGDPQGLSRQEAALRDTGALVAPSNAAAVRAAIGVLREAGR